MIVDPDVAADVTFTVAGGVGATPWNVTVPKPVVFVRTSFHVPATGAFTATVSAVVLERLGTVDTIAGFRLVLL